MSEFIKQADGTFVTVVKVLNEPDSNGRVWNPDAMKAAVERFNARVDKGIAYGELGQPSRRAGESHDEFKRRASTIDLENTCCQITDAKIEDNRLMAAVKPSGRWKGSLEQLMEDEVPLAIGIRAFADSLPNGEMKIRDIVTFDVISPDEDR